MSYHIRINGTPLCQCEGHVGGLLNDEVFVEGKRLSCGYAWKPRAEAAAKVLRGIKAGARVTVEHGECPAMFSDIYGEATA